MGFRHGWIQVPKQLSPISVLLYLLPLFPLSQLHSKARFSSTPETLEVYPHCAKFHRKRHSFFFINISTKTLKLDLVD